MTGCYDEGWGMPPPRQLQALFPHPCYLGASHLNCGWAWLYECSEYGSRGGEDSCDSAGTDPSDWWWDWICERWPHLCEQEGEIVRSIRARLYLAGVMLRRRHGLL